MRELTPPPNNPEAEQALIGAILTRPEIVPELARVLQPDDCYREAHVLILRAAFSLGANADLVTISQALRAAGHLEKVGGTDYLFSLGEAVSTSAGWRHWAEIVRDMSIRRKAILTCQQVAQSLQDLTNETDPTIYKARQAFNALDIQDPFSYRQGVDIANVYTAEQCLKEYARYVDDLQHTRFLTGIAPIDKRIRGVAGGELLFIIARAGSFKTALLQNFLRRYIHTSAWGTCFFSIEMPIASVTERYHEIIQGAGGRDIEDFYRKPGAEDYRPAMERDFVKDLDRLYVVPQVVSVKDAIQYVRLIEREFQTKIGLVGIDYLGLMDGRGRGEYEIVTTLCRDLKGAAKMLGLPFVILSQTSREAGRDGAQEINLSAGRGSGAIEESADVALGLYQEEDGLICKILKNRKGPKGSRWLLDLDENNLRIGGEATEWVPNKERNGV